jgi:hypothetical protein
VTEARLEEDLSRLPAPPRRVRIVALALMAITGALAAWLAIALGPEALYALGDGSAVELGRFRDANPGAADENVRVRAKVELQGAPVQFKRLLDGNRYHAAADGPGRWVVYAVPTSVEGPRFIPPNLVAGRLVRIESLGARFRGLASAIGETSGWVIVDGEDPESVSWIAGLELLLLAFVAWTTWSIARVLRRVN